MTHKILFSLTTQSGSFEILINGLTIPVEEWLEEWSNHFSYMFTAEGGEELQIRWQLLGETGDSFALRISLEAEGDLELGTWQFRIETGNRAAGSFTLSIPGIIYRSAKADTFSVDRAAPDTDDNDSDGSAPDLSEDLMPPPFPQPSMAHGQSAKPVSIHENEASGNYEVDVYYATDRNAITENTRLSFGTERGKLQFGLCRVSIPRNKALGEIPRPAWWKLEFHEDPDKHVMVLETIMREKEDFFAALKDTVVGANEHDAFVFIHGYNVGFDEAAWRTAQMAYDTGFGGAPIMYSWPSRASLEGYFSDEENVQYSHQNIVQFIKDVKERSGAQKLHLIAHSMGNRALTAAIVSLHESGYFKEISFNQIILAAPDIDAQIFVNDIAPNLAGCSSRITLYASSRDKALLASRKLRENLRRAGDAGDSIVVCPGIDTIDASTVDTDLLGHGYFAATETLLKDITTLLESGTAPAERQLKPVIRTDKQYWSF